MAICRLVISNSLIQAVRMVYLCDCHFHPLLSAIVTGCSHFLDGGTTNDSNTVMLMPIEQCLTRNPSKMPICSRVEPVRCHIGNVKAEFDVV